LAGLLIAQAGTTAATDYATGPIYGGSIAWAMPAPTVAPDTVPGFLGVTTFGGRFVAVGRGNTALTGSDGVHWIAHQLPLPHGSDRVARIAASSNRVVIVQQGVAWTSTDGDTWTAASTPPIGPDPSALVATTAGFVALGTAVGTHVAVVWRSTDGSAWEVVPTHPALAHFCPTAGASGASGRIVVVGNDCYQYLSRPVAIASDDGGLTWVRAPAQLPFSEEGTLQHVIAGGPGFLAVADVIRDVYPWSPYLAIYTSDDGLAWRRVGYVPRSTAGLGLMPPYLSAIPGGYLAFGAGRDRSDVYTSVDGNHWIAARRLPGTPYGQDDDFYQAITGLATLGSTIAALGSNDHVLFIDIPVPSALAFVGTVTPGPSRTGLVPVPLPLSPPAKPIVRIQPSFPGVVSWTDRPLPHADSDQRGSSSSASDVTNWRTGFAAVGEEDAGAGGSMPVVWTSNDGTAWTARLLPAECGGTRIASKGTTLVVAGDRAICRSTNGVDWVLATNLPHAIKGLVDVIGTGSGFTLVMGHDSPSRVAIRAWRSTDGLAWTSVGTPSSFTGQYPMAIAAGRARSAMLAFRWAEGTGNITPFTSVDGTHWTKRARPVALAPSSNFEKRLLLAGGPGFVAAGRYQPRSRAGAAVWVSSDGISWRRVLFVLPSSGFIEFEGLARIGPGYAVVGLMAPPSQDDPALPMAWLSPDSVHWRNGTALPLPDGPSDTIEIAAAAGGAKRLVAVGYRTSGQRNQAEVWTATYRAP
jgi:hypothetical protein